MVKRIKFDMDGVFADLNGKVREILAKEYPYVYVPRPKDQTTFYLDEMIEKRHRPLVADIIARQGFFLSLKPIKLAILAMFQISRIPHVEVGICTAPLQDFTYCLVEKYQWVSVILGDEWANKMILTRDKTEVLCDYLVDDKPQITGSNPTPSWEHIVVRRPYNINSGKRWVDFDRYEDWQWLYEELSS